MSKLMHETAHPLAGQVRRLHTTYPQLHGTRFLVLDWLERLAELPNGASLDTLKQELRARCTKAEHRIAVTMDWFFQQRIIVGYLGGDTTGKLILIDKDELPDLRILMTEAHSNSLSIVRDCAPALNSTLASLLASRKLSAATREVVERLKDKIDQIVKLVNLPDQLVTEAGIAGLEQAYQLSTEMHGELVALCIRLQSASAQRQTAYHANNGWMRHTEYYDRIGGRKDYVYDDHAREDDGETTIRTLRTMSTQLPGQYNYCPGSTVHLMDSLAFCGPARAFFDWLTQWENDQNQDQPA